MNGNEVVCEMRGRGGRRERFVGECLVGSWVYLIGDMGEMGRVSTSRSWLKDAQFEDNVSKGSIGRIIKMEGELNKQSRTYHAWQSRYFVLDGECLAYYRSEASYADNASALNSFSLHGITVEYNQSNRMKDKKRFKVIHHTRTLNLSSNSVENALQWIFAIRNNVDLISDTISETRLRNIAPSLSISRQSAQTEFGISRMVQGSFAIPEDKSIDTSQSLTKLRQSYSNKEYFTWGNHFRRSTSKISSIYGTVASQTPRTTIDELSRMSTSENSTERKDDSFLTQAYSLAEIVSIMVGKNNQNPKAVEEFMYTVLLYHKCFIESSDELFERISLIFFNPGSEDSELSEKDMLSIRLNCLKVIVSWFLRHQVDFNSTLKEKLVEFLTLSKSTAFGISELDSAIQTLENQVEALKVRRSREMKSPLSSNFLKKFAEEVNLLTIDPKDIAAQLTLYEYEMFRKLTPREFVNGAWTKKSAEVIAPTIHRLTQSYNKMSSWVASDILRRTDDSERRKTLCMFIRVGFECVEMNNYWGAAEIATGLYMAPIQRLKMDWGSISAKYKDWFKTLLLCTGIGADFKRYRKTLQFNAEKGIAQIPNIPLHLKELISLDSLETYDKNKKIIMKKYIRQFRILNLVLSSQNVKFTQIDFKQPIRVAILKGAEHIISREEMFQASYKIHPRAQKPLV